VDFLSWQIPHFSWEFASSLLSSWLSMDGALRNEEQGNKGLASATFSRGEKMETFIPNPCRFRRELERTRIRFFHFEFAWLDSG
jgi:hypothetical protein